MRFGLIGTGAWAGIAHGPGLVACPDAELVGVWGRDPSKAAVLAEPLGARPYDHVDALLADVDAVAFAVPPSVQAGLAGIPPGDEPTHGDFHEGQVHVADGRVVGILDVDTIGPGRRADDLACLIAHLSTIQRMNAEQEARVHGLLRSWVPVFDERVDPVELRLRAAAVIISLATGPYRGQEPDWERETIRMVDSAEALVRQVS